MTDMNHSPAWVRLYKYALTNGGTMREAAAWANEEEAEMKRKQKKEDNDEH